MAHCSVVAVVSLWVCLFALSVLVVLIQGNWSITTPGKGAPIRGVFNFTGLEELSKGVFLERNTNSSMVTLHVLTFNLNSTEIPPPIETPCCTFLGNSGHWQTRNMPVRVYQDDSLVTLLRTVSTDWQTQTGLDLVGEILIRNQPLTNTERYDSWDNGINVVGYMDLNNENILGVTSLRFTDDTLTHITDYSLVLNSQVPNLCNAANDPSCYDKRVVFNHEFGHVCGLGDVYDEKCSSTLMYWQLRAGTTRKRVIDFTAKSCVNELYEGFPLDGEQTPEDLAELNASSSTTASLTALWFSLLVAVSWC